MAEIIFLVEEDPDGGYTARAIGESIFTRADSLEELEELIQEAVRCHFLRKNLLRRVSKAERDYATGDVWRGSVADLMAALED